MNNNYRIGLDIGIGSVGWAVIENNITTEEPERILNLGVRTFNTNEVQKTGESTASSRREKRGIRRRNRRKAFRFLRMHKLFQKTFGENILINVRDLKNEDVYQLRAKAIGEKITNAELCKIILNLLKRRGFKSNRKSGAGEDGKLLNALKENQKFLADNNYRTIGEAIYKDERFYMENCGKRCYIVRNHGGDYRNCFFRTDLENELKLILFKQKEFNNLITDDFIERVIFIFNNQRNFDEGPGLQSPYKADYEVGDCTFLKGEKRAPKAAYTFEYFNALSKINSLKIDEKPLTFEEKCVLYEIIKTQKNLSFATIRKKLGKNEGIFNLCRYKKKSKEQSEQEMIDSCEKSIFVGMESSYEIRKQLKLEKSFDIELIDKVATMLSLCKSDAKRDEYAKNDEILCKLGREQLDAVESLNFDKFGSLSLKAMKMIIPYLLQGKRYDEAAKMAGFNHSSFEYEKQLYLKGERIDERLKDVTSPVVLRAVHQTLRIINEIIKKYGSPQFINIELAREISKNFTERNRILKEQTENSNTNEDIKNRIEKEYHITKVSGQDIIKYKLYMEQDGKCMYSGKPIDASRLFEPNYLQVDHILPYSRSMNDSFNNKVLVFASENQNKGNLIPYEYIGKEENRWNDFIKRVALINNSEKRKNLLKIKFNEEDENEYISRNLNDTRYMSKFLLNLFQDYLLMKESKTAKKQVKSVNGAITSYMRKCWGINKIREDGDIHHCIDAAVIAVVTESQIQKITKFNQANEIYTLHGDKYINKLTGEVLTAQEKQKLDELDINMLARKLPMPYDEFVEELLLRAKVDYKNLDFTNDDKLKLAKIGYDNEEIVKAKPVFISKMKTIKKSGAIHQETMMSSREYDKTKRLIKSVEIQKLKVVDIPEEEKLKDDLYPEKSIQDYYRPQDDRLLYLKLKKYLIENGQIPVGVEFHKPRADGSDGPIVKKVKQYMLTTSCVKTPNGSATNDKMFRVDVFEKDGKYYLCPVYMNDVYDKKLPNKVIVRGQDWQEIDDSFSFKFSLHQNDLIMVKSAREIVLKRTFDNPKSTKPEQISSNEFLLYYNSTGISTASITVKSYDGCYILPSLGVKTLLSIEKYYVDIMGNIYKAQKEERKPL